MKQSRQPRTPSELSEAVNHKLTLYALAASSAGVGLLALAQPAEAKIVYTKTHHVIGLSHPYKLDLNHDGTADFVLLETEGGSQGFKQIHLAARVELGNMVEGSSAPNGRGYAFALKAGAPISGHQHFVGARSGEFMATVEQSDTVFLKYYGNWYNVTDRYLGLKFKIGGKTHYGWARLNVDFQGFAINATLTGYAYETIPNKAIIAGKTKGPDEAEPTTSLKTPEPATLGLLALGAPGRRSGGARRLCPPHPTVSDLTRPIVGDKSLFDSLRAFECCGLCATVWLLSCNEAVTLKTQRPRSQ